MHLNVYQQSEIFYFAFVFGAALGIYYDLYRLLRYLGLDSKAAVMTQDIIFMSTAGVMCFLFAEVTVNGRLRAFVIFSHLIGFFSYRFSFGMLSGFVFKFLGRIFGFVSGAAVKFFEWITKGAEKFACYFNDKYRQISCAFVKKHGERKKFKTI